MLYGAKFALCSEIDMKCVNALCEHNVEFVNVKTFWNVKELLGFKRLTF